MVHAAGIVRVAVVVHCSPSIFLGQELLDLPVALFGANAELEVLAGNGVPVLVDHHDGKKVTYGGEEETVQVVLDAVADAVAEDVQDHLARDEDAYAEGNIS